MYEFKVSQSGVKSPVPFSHKIAMGSFSKDSAKWYRKEIKNPAVARRELLAQEFFRALIPHQPRTKLYIDPIFNIAYIFSEEVRGYEPFAGYGPTYSGVEYPGNGLGQAVMAAAFLQEIDLKNGNIGLDRKGRTIKIDGDWSFAGLVSKKFSVDKFQITPELINSLPCPAGYPAYNWLQFRFAGKAANARPLNGLNNCPVMRNEKYQTIQKIMLTPDIFMQQLAGCCFPAGADRFSDFLITRKKELVAVARSDPGFKKYLRSAQAQRLELEHQKHLRNFSVGGNRVVITHDSFVSLLFDKQFSKGVSFLADLIKKESSGAVKERSVVADESSALVDELQALLGKCMVLNNSVQKTLGGDSPGSGVSVFRENTFRRVRSSEYRLFKGNKENVDGSASDKQSPSVSRSYGPLDGE